MTWPTLALALGGPPTLVPCWNVKVQVAQLLKKEWRNPISGACCQLSGLQWNIGRQIKTSIEEKSENSKHTPQFPSSLLHKTIIVQVLARVDRGSFGNGILSMLDGSNLDFDDS